MEAHGKAVALIIVGRRPLSSGLHVVAAHIDSVRIDLKQVPIYSDANLAMMQTHYYGGIKPYQWLSLPLELRGIVVTKSGNRISVSIGAQASDPVFVIPDIAVHRSRAVDGEEGEEVPAESLDPIVSSTAKGRTSNRFVLQAKALLKNKYGIDARDLASAELSLVPALAPRDVGIDRALIAGYGQDDRACAYAAVQALFSVRTPKHTSIVLLLDKEEVGSTGNTGARSNFFRRVVAELASRYGQRPMVVDRILASSLVFSADVTGGVNPHYRKLYEAQNAAFIGSGIVWNQSAVHAEVMAYVRRLLDKNGITHQPAKWGNTVRSRHERGTVLPFFTRHGMNGLVVAIPLLSMHAPYELVSKADLYEGFRAYRAFLAD